jgi:hypothetical protein
MTKEGIESAVKAKGYVWFNDDANKKFDVNIVGVRNLLPGRKVTNVFDDKMTLSYKDETGAWKFHSWDITTDPGTKAMKEFHNPAGVFRLIPGQYRGMWAIGLHQGKYEAMRQVKPCKGWRDKNKDMVFDENLVVEGTFGINGHRSNPKTQSEYVENWSEGCQVFKRLKDFLEFMVIMNKAKAIHGNSFTYTLITTNDLV